MCLRNYRLKKPIVLSVNREDGVWCLENEELNVCGCGRYYMDAKKDVIEVLEAMVEVYLMEDDSNLSEDALKLKRKLMEYVELPLISSKGDEENKEVVV